MSGIVAEMLGQNPKDVAIDLHTHNSSLTEHHGRQYVLAPADTDDVQIGLPGPIAVEVDRLD